MKRLFALALALCLALSGCKATTPATPEPEPPAIEAFLVREAQALTADMAELAADPSYRTLMTISPELNQLADELAAQSWAAPTKATLVTLPLDALPALLTAVDDRVAVSSFSPAVQRRLEQMLGSSYIGSMLAVQSGTTFLATASIFTTTRGYVQPQNWSGPTIVLLEYGGDYAALASFSVSGEGVVAGSAMFATTKSLATLDALRPLLESLDPPVELTSRSFTGQELEALLADA